MALFRKMLSALGLLAFGFGLVLITPTLARALSIDESIKTTTSTQSNTSDSESEDSSSRNRVNTEVVESSVLNIRQKAEKLVADERKTRVKLDDTTREQLCNNRKNAIENKVSAFGAAANTHLDRLDGVYGKLDVYLKAHPVNGVDMVAAKASQVIAADKVAALQSVIGDATITCTNLTDNASWLMQVRTAAGDARDALKAYRAELKKVVEVIKQATTTASQATSTTNSTDGQ